MAALDVTPARVAALLRARTKDGGGVEVGEFNADTRPTLTQVEETVTLATETITAKVGDPGSDCGEVFATAVAYEAACLIEKSYWPEQVESGRSNYDQLRVEADAVIEGVKGCIAGALPGEGGADFQVGCTVTPGPSQGDELPADYWQRDLENPMP